MKDQYVPGMLSHLYQAVPAAERAEIDKDVDAAFVKETGVTKKLDWNEAKDKPMARQWLRIRDVVIGKRFLGKARQLRQAFTALQEKRIEDLAQSYRESLAHEVQSRGLPELHEDPMMGKIIEVGHLATETFDVVELTDLWPLILGEHVAHAATLYVTGILAPFVNLLGGLYAIGHANEAGQRGAERNAFKWGFAETIAAMARGGDWHPTISSGTPWGYQQARGRNAAIRLLKQMGPEVGRRFLSRYGGHAGKAEVLADMGGYD